MEYQPPQPPSSEQPNLPAPGKTSMGLDQNVAAALSYVCCWLTGLIFYLVEKDNNFVRFHAMQSIIAFGALFVLDIGLAIIGRLPIIGLIALPGYVILGIAAFAVFVICIIKAFQGERFHLPVVGDMAEKYVK
jgi:uncharacterized membrane protein